MAHQIRYFLGDPNVEVDLESLATGLADYFSDVEGLTLEISDNPADPNGRHLKLRWGNWSMSVYYEDGDEVLEDAMHVATLADAERRSSIEKIDRRIRVWFGTDTSREFTNHMIWMMEYMEQIPGVIAYDETEDEITN
jgi:hypothetical protein